MLARREKTTLTELIPCMRAQTTLEDKETGNSVAAVNGYFMTQDGSMFKAQVPFAPYFYLQVKVRPCKPPPLSSCIHLSSGPDQAAFLTTTQVSVQFHSPQPSSELCTT